MSQRTYFNWLLCKCFCVNIIVIIFIILIICSTDEYEKSEVVLRDTYARNLSECKFSSSEESLYVKRSPFGCFYLFYLMISRRLPKIKRINSKCKDNNKDIVSLDELRHVSDISDKKEIEKIFEKSYEMNECN
ncbi:Plasmodium exported protein (PHISTb), unknown function, partial [Plasmodium reichenowi]